jgi:hypothetical protein
MVREEQRRQVLRELCLARRNLHFAMLGLAGTLPEEQLWHSR